MLIDNSLTADDLSPMRNRSAPSENALRSFYSTAPRSDWAFPRKVWTVIGCATVSWGAVFGCAALVLAAGA